MTYTDNRAGWKEKLSRMKAFLRRRGERDIPQTGEIRERIMRRFEEWLDEVLTEQKPLEGIDRELFSELEGETGPGGDDRWGRREDRYSTWSAMTALTQEVKLQGRAFKEVSSRLENISNLGPEIQRLTQEQKEAVTEARELVDSLQALLDGHRRRLKTEADTIAKNNLIEILLDTRDRLMIGLASAAQSQEALDTCSGPRGLRKWFQQKNLGMERAIEIIAALKKGYRLGLERLDETLQHYGVFEISCTGEPFDPARMAAVDIEETADVPDGTVLDVYRPGYATDTDVIRTAQVKVARRPANHTPSPEPEALQTNASNTR